MKCVDFCSATHRLLVEKIPMQNLINHSTEHRSQMTPVLFELNVATPPLDYIYFVTA